MRWCRPWAKKPSDWLIVIPPVVGAFARCPPWAVGEWRCKGYDLRTLLQGLRSSSDPRTPVKTVGRIAVSAGIPSHGFHLFSQSTSEVSQMRRSTEWPGRFWCGADGNGGSVIFRRGLAQELVAAERLRRRYRERKSINFKPYTTPGRALRDPERKSLRAMLFRIEPARAGASTCIRLNALSAMHVLAALAAYTDPMKSKGLALASRRCCTHRSTVRPSGAYSAGRWPRCP